MLTPQIKCKCGRPATCFLTGYSWICKTCFDKKTRELERARKVASATSHL